MAKKTSNKGKLSAKDFEFFKTNIFKSDAELADILNRTEKFIQETRKKVYPNKKAGKWTNAELQILKDNKDLMSIDELSRFLNRSQKNIISKLETLNEKQEEDIKIQNVKEEIVKVEEAIQHETSNSEEHVVDKIEYQCELCGNKECTCAKNICINCTEYPCMCKGLTENMCENCTEYPCMCKGLTENVCCKDGECQCKNEPIKVEEKIIKTSAFKRFISYFKFW